MFKEKNYYYYYYYYYYYILRDIKYTYIYRYFFSRSAQVLRQGIAASQRGARDLSGPRARRIRMRLEQAQLVLSPFYFLSPINLSQMTEAGLLP